jgi:hypothetical protein
LRVNRALNGAGSALRTGGAILATTLRYPGHDRLVGRLASRQGLEIPGDQDKNDDPENDYSPVVILLGQRKGARSEHDNAGRNPE